MCNNICTVNNCENFKETGDLLFCKNHRYNWRSTCKLKGIEFMDIFVTDTELLLKKFREG